MKEDNNKVMDFLGISKINKEQCLIILSLISDRLNELHLQERQEG